MQDCWPSFEPDYWGGRAARFLHPLLGRGTWVKHAGCLRDRAVTRAFPCDFFFSLTLLAVFRVISASLGARSLRLSMECRPPVFAWCSISLWLRFFFFFICWFSFWGFLFSIVANRSKYIAIHSIRELKFTISSACFSLKGFEKFSSSIKQTQRSYPAVFSSIDGYIFYMGNFHLMLWPQPRVLEWVSVIGA